MKLGLARITLFAPVILLVACAAQSPPVDVTVDPHPTSQPLDYEALLAAPHQPPSIVRQRIVKTATSFEGAPAKRGGLSPQGFDCTGYAYYVYREAAKVSLPRRSHDQVQIGKAISPIDLQPGDLVYFATTGSRSLHVGVYLGEGRFIHAPSTGGTVRIESLGAPEWRTRFLGARQILAEWG